MKHTKDNLDLYARENGPRLRLMARQMLDMHTPEFNKHFAGEIGDAHSEAATALMRLALLMVKKDNSYSPSKGWPSRSKS